MTCEFTYLDGSYVLGGLSPAERQEFEQHLAGCPECARSVRELAGLPGLLARVDADALDMPAVPEPVSETLLPALLREVRRTQRRRMVVAAGLAAAAVVTIAGGTVALISDAGSPAAPPSSSVSVVGAAMTPLGQERMTARLAVETVQWGTRLDLTCSYAASGEYDTWSSASYAMFVHTADGHTEQVATWRALPGKTMKLAAATATHRGDITSVEIRTTDGTPVLTTPPR